MTPRSIWNPAVETLDRGARERLQTERLAATVEWARSRVPFYRARLAAPVEKLDDLRSLPFTHKSDLRDHYPFGLFAVLLGEVVRIHASSGTKGKPTVVGYTAVDLEVWREASTAAARSRGSRCTSRRRRRSSSGAAASTPSIPRCAASWPGAPQQAIALTVELTLAPPRTIPRSEGRRPGSSRSAVNAHGMLGPGGARDG